MNWKTLYNAQNSNRLFSALLFLMFFVGISMIMSVTSPNIDIYGHIGGLIYGFFLTWILIKPMNDNDLLCCKNKTFTYICVVILTLLYGLLSCLFFFVVTIS